MFLISEVEVGEQSGSQGEGEGEANADYFSFKPDVEPFASYAGGLDGCPINHPAAAADRVNIQDEDGTKAE